MTSIIFVHGTGGRKAAFAITLQHIEKALQTHKLDVELVPCLWGDLLGAKLNADGASIPTYEYTQSQQKSESEEEDIRLWEALYEDPFYELRLLGLRPLKSQTGPPGKLLPSQELQKRVRELSNAQDLRAELDQLGIGTVYEHACEIITGPDSKPFGRLLETASSPLDGDYAAIARAIVSVSRLLCKEQEIYPWLLINNKLRDQAVNAIQKTLTDTKQSKAPLPEWIKSQFTDLAFGIGTDKFKRKRGAVMNSAYPFAGDILVYQTKGKTIREFIHSQINLVEPPVVLLAHSLGGIACVDLLIEENLRNKVQLLITVGSQAPFFYEIGALQTLPYGEPIPEYFPEWLNIYDLRDFLSYVGDHEKLFAGKITDVKVDNKQPFPEAHNAYWANNETWNAIKKVLP